MLQQEKDILARPWVFAAEQHAVVMAQSVGLGTPQPAILPYPFELPAAVPLPSVADLKCFTTHSTGIALQEHQEFAIP